MSFSKLFDVDNLCEYVIKWIESTEDIFVNDIFKRKRFNRTKKIDYLETSWGEMLCNPHIENSTSVVAR